MHSAHFQRSRPLCTSPLASGHPGVTFRCVNPSSRVCSLNLWDVEWWAIIWFYHLGDSVDVNPPPSPPPMNTGMVVFFTGGSHKLNYWVCDTLPVEDKGKGGVSRTSQKAAVAKSQTLWLQSCFIHIFLKSVAEVLFSSSRFRRIHLSVLKYP